MIEVKHLGKGSTLPVIPDDTKLRLYSMRFCPYAQRIHLILDCKKIPHHIININLIEKPEWLTSVSRFGKVPALVLPNEQGQPSIVESLIIADYLDEKYPERKLYPINLVEKAMEKVWIENFNSIISTLYSIFLKESVELIDTVYKGLDAYETELNKRATLFFGGSLPGILDYMIWPWMERSEMINILFGKIAFELSDKRFPKLIKWMSLMKQDDAVKVTYITPDFHSKFVRGHKVKNPDYDMLVK